MVSEPELILYETLYILYMNTLYTLNDFYSPNGEYIYRWAMHISGNLSTFYCVLAMLLVQNSMFF